MATSIENQRKSNDKLRREVFDAYGNECVACGESGRAFLVIDHIGDDGGTHRKALGGGYAVYVDLRRRGWPRDEVQVLCANCNTIKQRRQFSDKPLSRMTISNRKLRAETFEAYGQSCVCCGFSDLDALCLDHVNDDGFAYRKETGSAGIATYRWLRQHGWPKGIVQTLCSNCNLGKVRPGGCPHAVVINS